MTIDEAILRLENTFQDDEVIISKKEDEAAKLGTEALKRISYARDGHIETIYQPLPGETKD